MLDLEKKIKELEERASTEKPSEDVNLQIIDFKQKLSKSINDLNKQMDNFVGSFNEEGELLAYAKDYVKTSIFTDLTVEEQSRKLEEGSIDYQDILDRLSYDLILTLLARACNKNGWSVEKLEALLENLLYENFNEPHTKLEWHLFGDNVPVFEEATTENYLESFSTKQLSDLYYANDKISNNLTALKDGECTPFAMEHRDKRNLEINTYVTVNFDGIEDTRLKKFTDFDIEVFNAVLTIWENETRGDNNIKEVVTTIQTIHKVLNKNLNTRLTKDQEEQRQAIKDSLNKLNTTRMNYNAEQESKYYKEFETIGVSREGTIINVSIDSAYINRELVADAVHILNLAKSPLYTGAKIRKQIGRVPFALLDTGLKRTEETRSIENYLIRRVESYKATGTTVLLSSILNNVGIYEEDYPKTWKTKKSRTIKKIQEILDSWAEIRTDGKGKRLQPGTGFIKSFKTNPPKGKTRGVYSFTFIPREK